MSYKDSCSRIALSVFLLAGFAAPVAAQTKADNGVSSGSDGSFSLQEIVVTAQKRPELLSKTPLAISVIGQQSLDKVGARSFTDAAKTLPNVSTGLGATIAIRGIGTSITGTTNGTVAFHTDGVFQNGQAQATASLYDIQRIEVLRGPQGTLYGRNATAGVVNVITNDANPSAFESFGDVSYQSHNDVTVRGVLNMPVNDKFALRLTGFYEKSDSWKVDENGNHPPDQNNLDLRLAWKYIATDNITWDGRLEWDHNHSLQAVGTPVYSYDPATGSFIRAGNGKNQAFLGSNWNQNGLVNSSIPIPYDSVYRGVSRNEANTQSFDDIALRSKLRIDLPDNMSLTYLLGYLHVDTHPGNISGLQLLQLNEERITNDDWSNELDLNYESSKFKGVLGAYAYDHQVNGGDELLRDFGPSATPTPGAVLDFSSPLVDIGQGSTHEEDTTLAIFGQGTYSVTDKFRLTGGLRYNWDRTRFDAHATSLCPFGSGTSATDPDAATFSSNVPGLGGLPVCSTLAQFVPTFYVNRDVPGGSMWFRKFSWKASGEYDIGPNSLAYATVSTGYKAGGVGDPALVGEARFFKPETDLNYELGVRTRLFNDRLSLNLTGFWTNYKNLQISFVSPSDPSQQIFKNAGRSRSRGLEFEYALAITPHDRIDGFATYLDATFLDFPSADPLTNVPQNFAGNQMSGAPKYSARINYSHVFDLGDSGTITPTAQFYYQADTFQSFANTIATRVPSYTRSDFIIRYETVTKSYFVEAFVNNIENRSILTSQIPLQNTEIGYYSPPRTFGVRVGFHH